MLVMGFCCVCQQKAGALFQMEESTALKMTSIVIKETTDAAMILSNKSFVNQTFTMAEKQGGVIWPPVTFHPLAPTVWTTPNQSRSILYMNLILRCCHWHICMCNMYFLTAACYIYIPIGYKQDKNRKSVKKAGSLHESVQQHKLGRSLTSNWQSSYER